MPEILVYIAFFAVPIIAVALFVAALCNYKKAKKERAIDPEKYTSEEITNKKILLIISALIAGGFVLMLLGYLAMFFLAIAFM